MAHVTPFVGHRRAQPGQYRGTLWAMDTFVLNPSANVEASGKPVALEIIAYSDPLRLGAVIESEG